MHLGRRIGAGSQFLAWSKEQMASKGVASCGIDTKLYRRLGWPSIFLFQPSKSPVFEHRLLLLANSIRLLYPGHHLLIDAILVCRALL